MNEPTTGGTTPGEASAVQRPQELQAWATVPITDKRRATPIPDVTNVSMLMRLKFRTRPAKAAMSAETLRAIWNTDDFRQRVKRQGMKVDLDHLHEDETVAALAKILGAPVSVEDLGEGQVVLTSVPDAKRAVYEAVVQL